jgi:hypothetical protein
MRLGSCGKMGHNCYKCSDDHGVLNCRLSPNYGEALTILCLGAHNNDIDMGCGGTILKLIEDHERTELYWVVFSSSK